MPEMSSKNHPQLVYISCACRCISINSSARTRSASVEWVALMLGKKAVRRLRAAVQHHLDVVVARGPHIAEELAAFLLRQRSHRIAQLIQSLPQRRAPSLVPSRLAAVAAAVRAPPLHAVRAAPRGVVHNLAFILRWKLRQKAAVVGQLDGLVAFSSSRSA